MSEQKRGAEFFADALAGVAKELVASAREANFGDVLVLAYQLDKLRSLAEAYFDEGNVELWITGCPSKDGNGTDKIRIIKAIRHILGGIGFSHAKSLVDMGLPMKLRSYTSLVRVEEDEKKLSGIDFERRKQKALEKPMRICDGCNVRGLRERKHP